MAARGGDLLRMLAQSGMGSDDAPERPKLAPDIEAIRLRDSFAAFNERHVFEPGMIVRQKPQVRGYQPGGDNDLSIVIGTLAEPIISASTEMGGSNYRQQVDMLIGSIEHGPDGETFAIFHIDSRRFEPVPEADIALATGIATGVAA